MSRTPGPINHGTIGGYQTHYNRGQAPCAECLRAARLHWSLLRSRQHFLPARVLDLPLPGAALARGVRECA